MKPNSSREAALWSEISDCANWMARPAYSITFTVSMPETSSKNQPQLVYISMAWRSISISLSTATTSLCESWREECRIRKLSIESGERSSTTLMYSSRASQGSRSRSLAALSKSLLTLSRSQSNAARSGPRQCCSQEVPELQPQWLFHRSMPWEQLQAGFSKIFTSTVGGCFSQNSP